MNENGFTLTELTVVIAGAVILSLSISSAMHRVVQMSQRNTQMASDQSDIFNLTEAIVRMGRLAGGGCQKISATELDCTSNGILYHFKLTSAGLLFEMHSSGQWVTLQNYPSVSGFFLCSESDMIPNSNGTTACAIPPDSLNVMHNKMAGATTHRYFRFQIQSSGGLIAQSAFFVRSPSVNQISYVWGEQK